MSRIGQDTSPSILVAVFILSAALLALEVLLVRLTSILFYPVSTYLVISLALLGYGISGTLLALRRSTQPVSPVWAARVAGALAASILLALGIVWMAGRWTPAAFLLPLALGLPFALGGSAIAIALSLPGLPVHRVYLSDLTGAGFGVVLVQVGIGLVGGVRLALVVAAMGLLASVLFARRERSLHGGWLALVAGLAAVGLLVPLPKGITPVAHKELAGFTGLGPDVEWEYQGWSSIARVDVLSLPGDTVSLPDSFEYKLVTQDGGAPSILLNIPDLASADFTDHTIFGIPYWLKSEPKVLIIGLGGGPDVQAALVSGAAAVTGVEINARMIDIVDTVFREWVHDLYQDERVTIIEGDGRHVVRLSDEAYDIIQLTGVDTSVASIGANPNLSENYLYTVEAFREYYQHLAPDGVLSLSFPDGAGLGLRLVATALEALDVEGVEDSPQHLVVSTTGGFAHVLVKHSPLTADEVAVLAEHFDAPMQGLYFPLYNRLFGWPDPGYYARHEILYAPGLDRSNEYTQLLAASQAGNRRTFLAAQPYTVWPPTDDWPFFFVLDKWGHHTPNLSILLLTLGLLLVASVVFVVAPLALKRRAGLGLPAAPLLVAYFAALGLGYILVEVVLIQKLSLFLGHPSHALVVTLCTLLVSSGLGSWASGRHLHGAPSSTCWRFIGLAAGGVTALVLAAAVGLDPLFGLLLRWPLAARAVVGVVIVAIPGFVMGMPFPTGLSAVKQDAPAFVPWAWAINSAATVVGTIVGVLLAMLYGFTIVFVTSALIYLAAALAARFYLLRTARRAGAPAPGATEAPA